MEGVGRYITTISYRTTKNASDPKLNIPAASAGGPSTAVIRVAHSYLHDLELLAVECADHRAQKLCDERSIIDRNPNPKRFS